MTQNITNQPKYGHWDSVCGELHPDTKYGFIYQITFLLTGQKYIGKKAYYSWNRTGTKKQKESNWRSYTSSSKEVNELIKEYGLDWFHLEILQECCTKSCWSYAESNIMHKLDVLTARDPKWEERIYLNRAINKVQWIPKECPAIKDAITYASCIEVRKEEHASCS